MKLHVLGLPHTELTLQYDWDAFTGKTRKFANMMDSLGYDVRIYGTEVNEGACTEHIPIISRAEQQEWFGRYNWSQDVFNEWDPTLPWWRTMNARAIEEIKKRMEPGDILGMSMGWSQKPVAEALNGTGIIPVEIGIGYRGVWAPFRVFESYALQHLLAAKEPQDDMRFFDVVIPNFFEVDSFPEGKGDGGYYLFIGRLTRRKGPHIAAEVCKRIGAKLLIAGQGIIKTDPVTTNEGLILEGNVEYAGFADARRRAELMGGAKAVFVPTIYLEAFGGVAVEAMMTGTPVITSDWGAFTETVIDGATGFRCRTLTQFVDAARNVEKLDRKAIRNYAIGRYSTEVVRHQYDRYFKLIEKEARMFGSIAEVQVILSGSKALKVDAAVHSMELSLACYQTGDYAGCITAAKEALQLRPNYPEAWSNICAANNMLGNFMEGRFAGEMALRLRPDYSLAKANLEWSMRELAKQTTNLQDA